jgi:DNA-binding Xre family transcriptional regulator
MLSLLRTMAATLLAAFIVKNRVKAVHLAEVSGISRQYIYRLRTGRMEPTRPVMLWITESACYIVKRRVEVWELFDLSIEINEELLT